MEQGPGGDRLLLDRQDSLRHGGESLADYLNTDLGWGLMGTALVFTLALASALLVQMRLGRYRPTGWSCCSSTWSARCWPTS